jgi:hypothetical protein
MGPLSAVVIAFYILMATVAPGWNWWAVRPSVLAGIGLVVLALVLLDAFVIGSGRWVRRYRVRGPRGQAEQA